MTRYYVDFPLPKEKKQAIAKTRGDETEQEWRRRIEHKLDNIERLIFHIRDAVNRIPK